MRQVLGVMTLLLAAGAAACSNAQSPAAPSAARAGEPAAEAATAAAGARAAAPSITEIAAATPGVSTLVAALDKAELVEFFDGQAHFTVFAPTNDAFDAAALSLGYADGPALVAALSVEQLTAILQYHVTRGDRNARSVLAAGSVRMLDGNTASVAVVGGEPRINEAPIVATDIRARNGIVHLIGGVLLPPE
jgi:uncharacterized surface protein with fasciclin (FAS1) repeats